METRGDLCRCSAPGGLPAPVHPEHDPEWGRWAGAWRPDWLQCPPWSPCMASTGPPCSLPGADGVLFLVSEAYHLGQEETDWFDKPRDARSERFRSPGGHAATSSQKRGPARHSYHDSDQLPEEGLWLPDEGAGRHTAAKGHPQHGDHGRHSGRHTGEELGRRSARPHARDMGRHPQPSPAPGVQKKSQPGHPSSAERSQPSRVPSAFHHGPDSKKGSRQAPPGPAAPPPKPEPQVPLSQGRQAAPGPPQSQPAPPRQTSPATAPRQPQPHGLGLQAPQQPPAQARLQQQGQLATRAPAPAASQPAGKPQPGPSAAAGAPPAGPVSSAPV